MNTEPNNVYPSDPNQQTMGSSRYFNEGSQQPYSVNTQWNGASYSGYPQNPYAYSGQHQQPMPPKKRKVWPWVLGGCLGAFLLFVLGIGGCVAATMAVTANILSSDMSYEYDYAYDEGLLGEYDGALSDSYSYGSTGLEGFTRDEIEAAFIDENLLNEVSDDRFTSGIYAVGEDVQPGVYYLEGRTDVESMYFVFEVDDSGAYELEESISYFGNYYVQLEAGELLVYVAGDNALLGYPQNEVVASAKASFDCGLYLVGRDMPAGTYTITASEIAAPIASMECAAYVMKDLEWDDDSVVESVFVMLGGKQTVTVKDGEWLELYASVATPSN